MPVQDRKAYQKAWYLRNRSRLLQRHAAYRKRRADQRKASDAAYRVANPDKVKAARDSWRSRNPQRKREWDVANPHKNRANVARRKASLSRATPAWANSFFIEEAYHLAVLRTKATGYPWHVDHIVPLRSKIVCGLHVETNLRVIPAVVNVAKNNRHWPDMPMPSVTSAAHSFDARGSK